MSVARRLRAVHAISLLSTQVREQADPQAFKKEVNEWSKNFENVMHSEVGRQLFGYFGFILFSIFYSDVFEVLRRIKCISHIFINRV